MSVVLAHPLVLASAVGSPRAGWIADALATAAPAPVALGADWSAHVPALIGVIAGLVLWLAGGRLMRAAIGLVGAALGASAGSAWLAPVFPPQVIGMSAQALGVLLGLVTGLALGLALFRFAMAVLSCLAFAAAGMLGAAIYLGTQPPPSSEPVKAAIAPLHERLEESCQRTARVVFASFSPPPAADSLGEPSRTATDHATKAVAPVVGQAREFWNTLHENQRVIFVGSGVGLGLIGLLAGALAPRRAAALITSVLGAGMLLANTTALVKGLALPGAALLDQPAIVWLVAWVVLSGVGACIQIARRPVQPQQN